MFIPTSVQIFFHGDSRILLVESRNVYQKRLIANVANGACVLFWLTAAVQQVTPERS